MILEGEFPTVPRGQGTMLRVQRLRCRRSDVAKAWRDFKPKWVGCGRY